MSYLIVRRSFHHSCFQNLIIRVPETKLGLFNYNEFAMYPLSKRIQLPPSDSSSSQPSSSQPSSSQSPLEHLSLFSSLPNLAIPVSYIYKSS